MTTWLCESVFILFLHSAHGGFNPQGAAAGYSLLFIFCTLQSCEVTLCCRLITCGALREYEGRSPSWSDSCLFPTANCCRWAFLLPFPSTERATSTGIRQLTKIMSSVFHSPLQFTSVKFMRTGRDYSSFLLLLLAFTKFCLWGSKAWWGSIVLCVSYNCSTSSLFSRRVGRWKENDCCSTLICSNRGKTFPRLLNPTSRAKKSCSSSTDPLGAGSVVNKFKLTPILKCQK